MRSRAVSLPLACCADNALLAAAEARAGAAAFQSGEHLFQGRGSVFG